MTITLYPKDPNLLPTIRVGVQSYCICTASTGDTIYVLKYASGPNESYPADSYRGISVEER